jgi:hypothetical protein
LTANLAMARKYEAALFGAAEIRQNSVVTVIHHPVT